MNQHPSKITPLRGKARLENLANVRARCEASLLSTDATATRELSTSARETERMCESNHSAGFGSSIAYASDDHSFDRAIARF